MSNPQYLENKEKSIENDEKTDFQKKIENNCKNNHEKTNNINNLNQTQNDNFQEKKELEVEKNIKDDNNEMKKIKIKKTEQKVSEKEKEKKNLNFMSYEGEFIGINIGSFKTVYSLFSNIEKNYFKKVLESDNSKRNFSSKICYTDSRRLFGFSSSPYIKKFLNSSYNNLSRLIGFDNCEIYNKELPFMINPVESFEQVFFNFPKKNENEKLTDVNILVDYLSLINDFLQINNNPNIINFTIPVPDYYTLFHREKINLINEALNLKNINIINESSALTMYYGFIQYNNLFFQKEQFDGMERILFIDFGYSKTSYIISSYSKNEFKVEKVICNPYLGGRNLDENILEHIIKEFKAKNNIDNFELNQKKKIDVLDEISKARNKLSLNEQSRIQITNFYKNNDLDMILSLSDLNYMISDKLDIFKDDLLNVIKGKENSIKFVQMAGEVMRTQILEKILKDNCNLSLEKNISIDECISIGGAISGFYFHNLHNSNENLFKNFYEYNYYNIYYSIFNNSQEIAFKKGMMKDKEKIILLPNSKTIKIKFFYDKHEVKFCLNNPVIIKYKINLNEPKEAFLIIDYSLKNPKIEIKKKIQKNIDIKVDGGFLSYDKENEIKNIQEKLKEHKDFEKDYFDYLSERQNLSKQIYGIKNSISLTPEDKENIHNQLEQYLNYLRQHEPDKKIRDEEIKKIKNKLEEYNKKLNDKK